MEDPAEHKKKERKKIPSPHWATRQCLLCWETKCNNHTIHRRTGERIAAIEQVLVLNRVTNIDHNLHVSLIIYIRKTKSSIRQPIKLYQAFQVQRICLCLENVLFGILTENDCPLPQLLNYFIIIGKLYLWDCRSKQILPNIYGFRAKIIAKYETEEKISNKEFFKRKWILTPYLS